MYTDVLAKTCCRQPHSRQHLKHVYHIYRLYNCITYLFALYLTTVLIVPTMFAVRVRTVQNNGLQTHCPIIWGTNWESAWRCGRTTNNDRIISHGAEIWTLDLTNTDQFCCPDVRARDHPFVRLVTSIPIVLIFRRWPSHGVGLRHFQDTGTGVSPRASVSPCQYHSTKAQFIQSCIRHWRYIILATESVAK
jgi:hypothetical protein